MREYGITFLAEGKEFDTIKTAILEKYPEAKINICRGYEHISLKRYSVSFPLDNSITQSVAKTMELREIILKARREATRNVKV